MVAIRVGNSTIKDHDDWKKRQNERSKNRQQNDYSFSQTKTASQIFYLSDKLKSVLLTKYAFSDTDIDNLLEDLKQKTQKKSVMFLEPLLNLFLVFIYYVV